MANIPRRAQMAHWHPTEYLIFHASQLVEQMGADPRLTDAQNLLRMARHKVADYIEGVEDVKTMMILSEVNPMVAEDAISEVKK